jgi:hypothetical protein
VGRLQIVGAAGAVGGHKRSAKILHVWQSACE